MKNKSVLLHKHIIIFLSLFILPNMSGCLCGSFGARETYYDIGTKGKNIVFLIDISGSMEGKNEGNITDRLRAAAMEKVGNKVGGMIGGVAGNMVSKGIRKSTTKLASAKRELGPAIRGLGETSSFTIVTFSNKAEAWNETLQKAEKGSKAKASFFVKKLESGGGTAALKGLKKAFTIRGIDTIFFLSDGYPSDGSRNKILKEVQRINRRKRVTIHAIGLGDDKDEQFMKSLARENNGQYREG